MPQRLEILENGKTNNMSSGDAEYGADKYTKGYDQIIAIEQATQKFKDNER